MSPEQHLRQYIQEQLPHLQAEHLERIAAIVQENETTLPWENLPNEHKVGIQKGLQAATEGRLVSHEEAMALFDSED